MRNSWAQPSLSRDFALLSLAILFILCIISAWVTFSTYTIHSEHITADLEKESIRIERTLATEMENANYILTALGKQIAVDPDRNLVRMAHMLKSFASKGYVYTLFSWVNPQQQLVVSSNKGVLDNPIDISDRDYVKQAAVDPWKMAIGRPVEGRASGRWIIPVAMGLTDATGKFIGTIMISIDINTLSDQISTLVHREGISFAVVSKTLIPLTQVSDDKDFINDYFPLDKLADINFVQNPHGTIVRGSILWGTGIYAYYRVAADYPYVILLGYDTRYSDETVRNLLWSRLLQMVAMAVFFVLFLWIVRVRMIKPVLDMTTIATNVAKGDAYTPLPGGGPVEIEALATQLRRVGEYIEETKRIEDELRNKMFMLKTARDRAEMSKRAQSEFMAHICNEMRTPLNTIIGGAQVMKDQLYGPLENRKYRQYATDIYVTGNQLLDTTQELQTLARAETGYIGIEEKPVDVAEVISKALQMVSDKTPGKSHSIRMQVPDPAPMLVADEFRLQQILANLLLHAIGVAQPGNQVSLEAQLINENRDKALFAFIISTSDRPPYTQGELLALYDRLMQPLPPRPAVKADDLLEGPSDIGLDLAKALVTLHHGMMDIRTSENGALAIVVLFAGNRLRFAET